VVGSDGQRIKGHGQALQHVPHHHQTLVHLEPHTVLGAVAVSAIDEFLAVCDEYVHMPVALLIGPAGEEALLHADEVFIECITQCHEGIQQVLVLRNHAQHTAVERLAADPRSEHLGGEQQFDHRWIIMLPLVGSTSAEQLQLFDATRHVQATHPLGVTLAEEHVGEHMLDRSFLRLVRQQLVGRSSAQLVPERLTRHALIDDAPVEALPRTRRIT